MDSEQGGLSIEQILGIIRRRAVWVVLCLALVTVGAYAVSKRQTKKYTATASLAFSLNSLSQQIAGLAVSSGSSLLAQQASNVELVKLGDMASKTASLIGQGLTEAKVAQSLSISGQAESSIVNVSATTTSPVLAAQIVNVYTRQFVSEQVSANHQYFKSALALVEKQLARLPPPQRYGTDGLNLQDRAQTLSLLAGLNYGDVQVAQEALTPSSPSSPKTKEITILGAIVGLFVGLAIALLLEHFDRRVRRPDELESIYGLPMLGVVPKSAALSASTRSAGSALPPADAEAFSLIRAHLRFFNIDRDVRTLVIGSPAQGEGKTTIARYLAEAAARSGSRVLLLETDLRKPTLAQQLRVNSGSGLAGVLIGAVTMDAAIQSVALEASPGEGITGRTLDVLVAGEVLPPNPGELLESRAMDATLARAKSAYDLVVVDTPPLTAVSDAFPLLTKVDGVVIVGWVGRSRRDVAAQLQQVLAGSGAPLLGIVANGSTSGGPSSYADQDGSKSISPPSTQPANHASSSGLAPPART
jgi:capsular exopolysaccharide synthesis family protein